MLWIHTLGKVVQVFETTIALANFNDVLHGFKSDAFKRAEGVDNRVILHVEISRR